MRVRQAANKKQSFETAAPVIDMGRRLYDLRQPLDAVFYDILDARAEAPEKPVIVLMGEDHDAPVTRMMQYGVLQRCAAAGLKAAYATEYPYNTSHILQYPDKLYDDPAVRKYFNQAANAAPRVSHDFFKAATTVWMEHIALLCDDLDIPVYYNDAARDAHNDVLTDRNDPITREFMAHLDADDPRYYCAASAKGGFLRNAIIAGHIQQMQDEVQPDVIVQMLGSHHVFGNMKADGAEDHAYRHSLHNIMMRKNANVVSFYPRDPAGHLPPQAMNMPRSVFAKGWENARSRFMGDRDVSDHQRYIARQSKLPEYEPLADMDKDMALFQYLRAVKSKARTLYPAP